MDIMALKIKESRLEFNWKDRITINHVPLYLWFAFFIHAYLLILFSMFAYPSIEI